jgi:hypothetical protein
MTGVGQWTISSGVGQGQAVDPSGTTGDDGIAEVSSISGAAPTFEHVLFVTSRGFSPGKDDGGHFNSFDSASARCRDVAAAHAALSASKWIALVSDAAPLASHGALLVGDIVNMKRQKLYNSGDPFGKLITAPTYDEAGNAVADGTVVWTGSTASAGQGKTCDDWKLADADDVTVGDPKSRRFWLEAGTKSCRDKGNVNAFRLYCLSVP